jgi:hypothetical protein
MFTMPERVSKCPFGQQICPAGGSQLRRKPDIVETNSDGDARDI